VCLDNYLRMREQSDEYESEKKKVLIIDDEIFNCEAFFSIFEILKVPNVRETVDVAYSG